MGSLKKAGGPPSNSGPADLMKSLQARQKEAASVSGGGSSSSSGGGTTATTTLKSNVIKPTCPIGKLFHYDESLDAFLFDHSNNYATTTAPRLTQDGTGNPDTNILVPLAPCVYRMCDYTLAKKEPILLKRCILKLGVLRCLQRECENLNNLLWHRLSPEEDAVTNNNNNNNSSSSSSKEQEENQHGHKNHKTSHAIEEDELGKARFMELLSNCGVYQKVLELLLTRAGQVAAALEAKPSSSSAAAAAVSAASLTTAGAREDNNPFLIPQVVVEGLDDFLAEIEKRTPALQQARDEIETTQTVSFYPGLGELFCPGSKLLVCADGMEGRTLGGSLVQSWYVEELNKATNKMKRRFVLVIEFIVSVGTELCFVAASDVVPEFHDTTRNVQLRDLVHRKLNVANAEDAALLQRLQQRGEFYASVATHNHYLEYYPNSFFPILSGWSSNAVRPLSKGGRVMVDVKRGILEGHIPIRATSDGMSDTVKEAIKLFEQSKRTGVAVPFRTCILPGFDANDISKKKKLQLGELEERGDSDRHALWQSWPMLTGFSFTARVWGKLLLGMPKAAPELGQSKNGIHEHGPGIMVKRPSMRKMGVELGGLGGEGSCGNAGYIKFQEQAFAQLVLSEDKKELIRAVARNAGGGTKWEEEDLASESFDDEDSDDESVQMDVVANKGGASIFLLQGPAGTGKTLTAGKCTLVCTASVDYGS